MRLKFSRNKDEREMDYIHIYSSNIDLIFYEIYKDEREMDYIHIYSSNIDLIFDEIYMHAALNKCACVCVHMYVFRYRTVVSTSTCLVFHRNMDVLHRPKYPAGFLSCNSNMFPRFLHS